MYNLHNKVVGAVVSFGLPFQGEAEEGKRKGDSTLKVAHFGKAAFPKLPPISVCGGFVWSSPPSEGKGWRRFNVKSGATWGGTGKGANWKG